MDVIDYEAQDDYKIHYDLQNDVTTKLVSCEYFTTNLIQFDCPVVKDYYPIDSFVIYMCLEGSVLINFEGDYEELMTKGESNRKIQRCLHCCLPQWKTHQYDRSHQRI